MSGQPELPLAGRGEAPRGKRSGETRSAAHENERAGIDDEKLLELVVESSNVEAKRRVARKALVTMKDRVRDITKRSAGRSISSVIKELRGYLVGWKNYFQLADTPTVFDDLDKWIRHRLRAIHLKQWKRGTTIFRELVKRGMRPEGPTGARRIAANGRRWWRNSGKAINIAFPISYFDGLGLPRLAATSTR